MSDAFDIAVLRKNRQEDKKGMESPRTQKEEKNLLSDLLSREFTFLSKPFPDSLKEFFYLELSSLLEAGLDMKTSLEVIKDEQTKEKHRVIFESILRMVISGDTLSHALKSFRYFTPHEYFSVQIGEETAELTKILKELSLYFKSRIRQRKQLTGALTYPMIVLFVACGAIFFMMNYVVPMFADIFKRFGNQLPWITQTVLSASQFFRSNFFLLAAIGCAIALFLFLNRKKDWYVKFYSTYILRIPLVGALVKKVYLLRFASTMSLLINAHVPLLQAIGLVKQMLDFFPLVNSLKQIESDILNGVSLHQAMARHSIFPGKMITMVKVGEEVNQLEIFFGKIADYYSLELEHQTSVIGKFIEPAIILLLGLIVGLILIAMYLPLFSMGNMIN